MKAFYLLFYFSTADHSNENYYVFGNNNGNYVETKM